MRLQPWWIVVLGIAAGGVALPGCLGCFLSSPGSSYDDDDLADDDDDDDADPPAEITHLWPESGEDFAYYRRDLLVRFDEEVPGVTMSLHDGWPLEFSLEVEGTQSHMHDGRTWVFDPYGDDPDQHLIPENEYIWLIEWQDQVEEVWFMTSDVGEPVVEPEWNLVGNDYYLDIGTAYFDHPPGIGGILTQYLSELFLILHVEAVDDDAGTIELVLGSVLRDGEGGYVQDLCQQTTHLTAAAPGTWDNPYFQVGPTHVIIGIDYPYDLHDLFLSGCFTPDAEGIVGMVLRAIMDTRAMDELIDPAAEEGAACDLLASLGLACEDCPGDDGTFCLTMAAREMLGERVTVHGEDPASGEPTEGLVEVTAEQLLAWQGAGVCP